MPFFRSKWQQYLWPIRLCYWFFNAAFQFKFEFLATEKFKLFKWFNDIKFGSFALKQFSTRSSSILVSTMIHFFHNSKLTSLWHENILKYTHFHLTATMIHELGRVSSELFELFFYLVALHNNVCLLLVRWNEAHCFLFKAFFHQHLTQRIFSFYNNELCQLNQKLKRKKKINSFDDIKHNSWCPLSKSTDEWKVHSLKVIFSFLVMS